MKLLLTQDTEKLGKMGDIVNVKDGYARNYLIPRKLGVLATEKNIKAAENAAEKQAMRDAKKRENMTALADQLNKLTIKFTLKAGEDDKLFGSVTSQMIAEAIATKGYKIDKKEIDLQEPIKHIGNHFVQIKLGEGIEGRIKLKVLAEA
jgi:large subunit ribosomal protein L9